MITTMKKRIALLVACCLILFVATAKTQAPKYIFLMIGDGMGIDQTFGTEYYQAAETGTHGMKSLSFTQFPYSGFSRTYSTSNDITDSAAGGTALSVCQKTDNGVLGMDSTRTISLTSIAQLAKEKGHAVGITSSVSIDHATPAAFYSHVPNRGMYYQIGTQMAQSQFDFFGGSDFLAPTDWGKEEIHLHTLLEQSGYTICKGYPEYMKAKKSGKRIFLTQAEKFDATGKPISQSALPYAIDRQPDDLSLAQITTAAIEVLSAQKKGFFLMVEGGKIDWACHAHDAATAFHEVIDFDQAIQVAYAFYQKHPDETLIVVTADHETGGLGLGTNNYDLHFDKLNKQKCSISALSQYIEQAIANPEQPFSWEIAQEILKEKLGFWSEIKLNAEQEEAIKSAYRQATGEEVRTEYSSENPLAAVAIRMLNQMAHCGWTSGTHTGAPVPIYAIGVGAERFTGVMQNTEIPRRIAEIAEY